MYYISRDDVKFSSVSGARDASTGRRCSVREIARALYDGGRQFLWSLRKPPPEVDPGEYEDFGEVLPEGFVGRTEGFGRVIGWAPQAEVLGHRAVDGFVSHCRWNSMLGSVGEGVPMAAWLMYTEQSSNAFQLVRELGAAVEINMMYKKGANMVVSVDEIEKGIGRLMEAGGGGVGVRMEELRVEGRAAVAKGGLSYEAVGRFIEDVKVNCASSIEKG
ncbi:UDP-glycosyltransferase 71B7 [Striga hermonthica]|uniref:UDP-glycosyltransferase 71B7 n=1 Tax=Striga hermonthica TaxID=68872 RepID=A0A9N7MU07_STRHE|nr:UDP-glycosyltransferase 71B7 [Striga hermonthica]